MGSDPDHTIALTLDGINTPALSRTMMIQPSPHHAQHASDRDHRNLSSAVVTAAEMQAIEQRWFDVGMPVAALMEKAATAIADRLVDLLSQTSPTSSRKNASTPSPTLILILAGPGHNGGDALVVARELWLRGYSIKIYQPFERLKPLTQQHASFADYLDIPRITTIEDLEQQIGQSLAIVDGFFGFGQTRGITGDLATAIDRINQAASPETLRVAIDIPSGIHTDTGSVIRAESPSAPLGMESETEPPGMAFRADVTLCLGLRKVGLLCDAAQPYVGRVE